MKLSSFCEDEECIIKDLEIQISFRKDYRCSADSFDLRQSIVRRRIAVAGMRTQLKETMKIEWELTKTAVLGLGRTVAQLGKKAVQLDKQGLELSLHYQLLLELQQVQQNLGHQGRHFDQQVLGHLGVRVLLEVQQVQGHRVNLVLLVYLEIRVHRRVLLVLDHQGRQRSPEHQVCLEGLLVLGHRGIQEHRGLH
jgi:hypothetical protein